MELKDLTFHIPGYQRGYRWKGTQIRDLIRDLYDFVNSDRETYCLQPIVVKGIDGKADSYEVLDGQQRLTSLWLIMRVAEDFGIGKDLPDWNFEHENKDSFKDTINGIRKESKKPGKETLKKAFDDPVSGGAAFIKQDIDSKYLENAMKAVYGFKTKDINNKTVDIKEALGTIFNVSNGITGEKKCVDIIWSVETGGTTSIINKFMNINSTKIELTNAELIKAYFAKNLPKEKEEKFNSDWEIMEQQMENNDFWGFITSSGTRKDDYPTPIEMLFEVYAFGNGYEGNKDSFNTRTLSEFYRDNILRQGSPEQYMDHWNEIKARADILYDWYQDYTLYHLVGLITEIGYWEEKANAKGLIEYKKVTENNSKLIQTLYDKYIQSKKSDFKDDILKSIGYWAKKNELMIKNNTGEMEIDFDNESLRYPGKDNCIKLLLLLYNVALLLRAHDANRDNESQRFPFWYYKSEKIDIEHINPKHFEGKKYTDDDRKNWAKDTIKIVDKNAQAGFKSRLRRDFSSGCKGARWDTFVNDLETAACIHDFDNLTLLDLHINRTYHDDFFRSKRAHILAAQYGLPKPVPKGGGKKDELYEESIIFPGTLWVFLRHYIEPPVDGEESDSGSDRWVDGDRKAYRTNVEDTVLKLLKERS